MGFVVIRSGQGQQRASRAYHDQRRAVTQAAVWRNQGFEVQLVGRLTTSWDGITAPKRGRFAGVIAAIASLLLD